MNIVYIECTNADTDSFWSYIRSTHTHTHTAIRHSICHSFWGLLIDFDQSLCCVFVVPNIENERLNICDLFQLETTFQLSVRVANCG